MSSFASRLVKRIKEKGKHKRIRNSVQLYPNPDKPQRYLELDHGNFAVYHPTKGWRRVSGKRYWALLAMGGVGK